MTMQKFKNQMLLEHQKHQEKMQQLERQYQLEVAKHELEGRKFDHQRRTETLAVDPTGAAVAHQAVVEDGLKPMIAGLQQAMAQRAAAHAAPIQIHRDPQTGRAIGASRRLS
jgi:hypothetical protein